MYISLSICFGHLSTHTEFQVKERTPELMCRWGRLSLWRLISHCLHEVWFTWGGSETVEYSTEKKVQFGLLCAHLCFYVNGDFLSLYNDMIIYLFIWGLLFFHSLPGGTAWYLTFKGDFSIWIIWEIAKRRWKVKTCGKLNMYYVSVRHA